MNAVIELGERTEDLHVAIGPADNLTDTLYDGVQITHISGRTFGDVNRVQYFAELTPHGAAVVVQLRFTHTTLDILLDPANRAHRANLEALSKQPTLPVYQYLAVATGGRDLARRHVLQQPILVRKGIVDCLNYAAAHNTQNVQIAHLSWAAVVAWAAVVGLYRESTVDLPGRVQV